MEYKTRRNEPTIKGTILFDDNSTISISPVNFQGLPKYNGCCIYIGTPQKKDYFLCAASAAHTMDEQRKIVCLEFERLSKDTERQQEAAISKLKELDEKTSTLSKEKDQLVKERDSALQEAHMWRSELAKARERAVILEGAVVRAEEKARGAEASGEAKAKEASQREATAWTENQELLAYVNMLQSQLQRQQLETKQVFEEKTESTNGETSLPMTKETEKDVDKACLSISRTASIPGENVVHMSEDQVVNAQPPVGENEWNDIQATEARVSDVREIPTETERDRSNSLDITVVTPDESNVPRNDLPPESFHHQP
jgi:hypothetical protein